MRAICGRKDSTPPTPATSPSQTKERTSGEPILPPAHSASREKNASSRLFPRSPGIPRPKVRKNTRPAARKKAGSAIHPLRNNPSILRSLAGGATYPAGISGRGKAGGTAPGEIRAREAANAAADFFRSAFTSKQGTPSERPTFPQSSVPPRRRNLPHIVRASTTGTPMSKRA